MIHRAGAIPCTIDQVKLSIMKTSVHRLCRVSLCNYRRLLSYLTLGADSYTRNLRTLTGLGLPKSRHSYAPVQSIWCLSYWPRFCKSVRSVSLLLNSMHPKCYEYFTSQTRKWNYWILYPMLRKDMHACII